MNILVVSATVMEIEPLREHLAATWIKIPSGLFSKGNTTVEILIAGIGMHRMAYALGKQFELNKPDLCINAGIAGAYKGKATIGEVVQVEREIIADLGAEDADGNLITIERLGLNEDISSIHGLINRHIHPNLQMRAVKGVTVNTGRGSESSIQKMTGMYDPDIETLESAAFFYSCLQANVPFIAIRGISNIVEPRNRDRWNIPLAVENLNKTLIGYIDGLAKE